MAWPSSKWLLAACRCVPTWRAPGRGSASFASRRCQKPCRLLIWSRSSSQKFRARDLILSLSRCHLTCGQASFTPPRPAATPATRYAALRPTQGVEGAGGGAFTATDARQREAKRCARLGRCHVGPGPGDPKPRPGRHGVEPDRSVVGRLPAPAARRPVA